MLEIRIHGRGGQGAVTSSKIAGIAGSIEGKHVQALPFYGFERRGAPVEVYLRLDDQPIYIASRIYQPDGIIVLDPVLSAAPEVVGRGMKKGGLAILNTTKTFDEITAMYQKAGVTLSKVAKVDATGIAIKALGQPITNTAILGAFCKATGMLKLNSLFEGVKMVLAPRIHQANVSACQMAYDQVEEKNL